VRCIIIARKSKAKISISSTTVLHLSSFVLNCIKILSVDLREIFLRKREVKQAKAPMYEYSVRQYEYSYE